MNQSFFSQSLTSEHGSHQEHLIYHVWLISLGVLSFSEGKGGETGWGGEARKEDGRGNCSWNIIFEREKKNNQDFGENIS